VITVSDSVEVGLFYLNTFLTSLGLDNASLNGQFDSAEP